jgi:hypothetical protein
MQGDERTLYLSNDLVLIVAFIAQDGRLIRKAQNVMPGRDFALRTTEFFSQPQLAALIVLIKVWLIIRAATVDAIEIESWRAKIH